MVLDPRIGALNRDFERFDQVEKKQIYRLAEDGQDDLFDDEFTIQTVDLGRFLHGDAAAKRAFAQDLGSALEAIGFAILIGQDIPLQHYQRMGTLVQRFFEETPDSERLPYRSQRFGSVNQGYFPIKQTSQIHPDLVEGWVFCRRAFDFVGDRAERLDAFWPRPEFEAPLRDHVLRHEPLILPIMQSLLMYLGCDPHQYDQSLRGTNFGLRLNYYPPLGEEEAASGAGRILGHEDVNLFTLLPAPSIEGLQVFNRANNRWIRLAAPPGSIILNSGDYLQRISNDVFPSTTHRVSIPRDRALYDQPRITFPLAVYTWEEEILRVLPELPQPKYPPIKALDFHTHCTSKFYGAGYAVGSDAPQAQDHRPSKTFPSTHGE